MTDDRPSTEEYSGDVRLDGFDAPIELHDPEDVFVLTGGVDGDLSIRDPEYAFVHGSADGDASIGDLTTAIRGDLEDGYVPAGGVEGDLSVSGPEDVFVAGGAAGSVSLVAAENVYADEGAGPSRDPAEYDVSTVGWEQSGSASAPEVGVYAAGSNHEIRVESVQRDVEVYLVGHGHDVEIDGRGATVSVSILGYENVVRVGPYLDAEVVADTGFDNSVEEEPYPVEDLIETTRKEAFRTAGFGRRKITFQVPAEGDDWCPNCGSSADAIVERHQMEAFFVFGRALKVYDRSTSPAKECEHCSRRARTTSLTEDERRDVLR